VRRLLIRPLQLPSPIRLLTDGKMGHDILAFVPGTPLYRCRLPEDPLDAAAQAFAAVDDDQKALLGPQPPTQEFPEKLRHHSRVLGRRLHKPQDDLLRILAQSDHPFWKILITDSGLKLITCSDKS
jgi:hypothetical protein